MKKYDVEITEILQRIISIEAEDENEAHKKVSAMYKCGEIVLDSDDFIDKEINLLESNKRE